MTIRAFMLAAVFAILAARPVHAQLSEAQPGTRIRVTAPGVVAGQYEGLVLQRLPDTVIVASANALPLHIPIARVTQLEVSRGKSRSAGALQGMKWGTPIGLAAGLATMSVAGELSTCDYLGNSGGIRPCESGAISQAAWVGLSTFSGVVYGALVGALIGREVWQSYDLGRSVSLQMVPSGTGLTLSLRF